jgi:hypothetical protein
MRPVAEWDESDLHALIHNEVQESLTLDYKRSGALGKGSTERNNLSKDLSAFANSDGGMLIYGMEEDRHVPTAIDAGVDRTQITKEWLESVSKTNIHPTIDRMLIKQVPLPNKGPNQVAYVLEIGQATSRAPHQAVDHRYYKRFNFESTPMEDYEVRDLMRRSIEYGKKYSAAWDLNVEVRRLISAIEERMKLSGADYLPRNRLIIGVSPALRSAGTAIVLLEKPLRNEVAELINKVDDFNHKVETIDPGNYENARLNQDLKNHLGTASRAGEQISDALKGILEREP